MLERFGFMGGIPEYALERLYDAPDELIWKTWTDAPLFSRWYGAGVQTIVHKMDVRPGGEGLIELKWDNNSLFQKFRYLEVEPHERLTWLFSSTNEAWEMVPSPIAEAWPANFLTTIKLEPHDGKYILHLSLTPVDATEAEVMAFRKARLNIDAGWNAGMKVLDEIVEELKNRRGLGKE
jgi:uncharacterized protein YndB with AHSA1/START domain